MEKKDLIPAWVKQIFALTKHIILPGFDGASLYDVTVFFFRGITKGYITSRAAAMAYSFFLAIFPFLIMLFTIIPFIPIANFQDSLMGLLRDFLPDLTFESTKETINDIIRIQHGGLLSLSFVLTLYFSTNGVNSMIAAFNSTYHTIETRSTIKQYLISIALVLLLSTMLILAIGSLTFGTYIFRKIFTTMILEIKFYYIFLQSLKWLIAVFLLFFAISFVYYLAPAAHHRFRFISAGSTLATILVIVSTLGFKFYVDNFSRYNALYGSIGTLMIVMVWIYIIALSLLIGFELNASILVAKKEGSGQNTENSV